MNDLLTVLIPDEVREILPDLRFHVMAFADARIGVGHAGLNVLRRRVVSRAQQCAEEYGDAELIPQVAALHRLLRAFDQDPDARPPLSAGLLVEAIARAPFMVENDARDTGQLLSVFYRLPVFLIATAHVAPPLSFLPCPKGVSLPTPGGPVPAPGAPVLTDRRRPLRSLQHEVATALVTESTREFLLLIVDPGAQGGLEHAPTVHRAQNWIESLTDARLTGSQLC